MSYLVQQFGVLDAYFLSTLSIFVRYCVIAGSFFFVFYVWKKQKMWRRKIQQRLPSNSQMLFEIGHSILTTFIFGLTGIGIYWLNQQGWTRIYTDISEYGWAWLIGSFILLTFIHDTWFYWMHRLIHLPGWFTIFHRVHHRSHNPTPWAALSFHPSEAILEIAFLPIVVMLLPFHPLVIFSFTLFSLVFNVVGHLGYEVFPSGFTRRRFFRWFNTATHHNLHHQRANCNYGLYYNFWDTWMGTNHGQYHEAFEKVKKQELEATEA
jgi:sterol desaturase/sphingolipid hydroxylase (fatty acid hydroxylase superfamily)